MLKLYRKHHVSNNISDEHKLITTLSTVCTAHSKRKLVYLVGAGAGAGLAPVGLSPPVVVIMEVRWHITHLEPLTYRLGWDLIQHNCV